MQPFPFPKGLSYYRRFRETLSALYYIDAPGVALLTFVPEEATKDAAAVAAALEGVVGAATTVEVAMTDTWKEVNLPKRARTVAEAVKEKADEFNGLTEAECDELRKAIGLEVEREILNLRLAAGAGKPETVRIARLEWEATITFPTQARMTAFIEAVEAKGCGVLEGVAIAGTARVKILEEGSVLDCCSGRIVSCECLDEHLKSPGFLKAILQQDQWALKTASQRQAVLKHAGALPALRDALPPGSYISECGVPRLIRIARRAPPPPGMVSGLVVLFPPAQTYVNPGNPAQRLKAAQAKEEIKRRVQDVLQLPARFAVDVLTASCHIPGLVPPMHRNTHKPKKDDGASAPAALVRITCDAATMETLKRTVAVPALSVGDLVIEPDELYFDLATGLPWTAWDSKPPPYSRWVPNAVPALKRALALLPTIAGGALFQKDEVLEVDLSGVVGSNDPVDNAVAAKLKWMCVSPHTRESERLVREMPVAGSMILLDMQRKYERLGAAAVAAMAEWPRRLSGELGTLLAVLIRQAAAAGTALVVQETPSHDRETVKWEVIFGKKTVLTETGPSKGPTQLRMLKKATQCSPDAAPTTSDYINGLLYKDEMMGQVHRFGKQEKPPARPAPEPAPRGSPAPSSRRAEQPAARPAPTQAPALRAVPIANPPPTPRPLAAPVPSAAAPPQAPKAASAPAAAVTPRAAAQHQAADQRAFDRKARDAEADRPRKVAVPPGRTALATAPPRSVVPVIKKAWDHAVEANMWKAMEDELPRVSRKKIMEVKNVAFGFLRRGHRGEVMYALERRLKDKTLDTTAALAAWYLLDALIKDEAPESAQVREALHPKIERLVGQMPSGVNRERAVQLVGTWEGLFDQSLFRRLLGAVRAPQER